MTAITNTYREPILPEHKGNPLIEVLLRLCESELLQCWKRKPNFDVSEREKDKRYRRLCLTRLGNSFIWPLEIYLEFYSTLACSNACDQGSFITSSLLFGGPLTS